MTHNLTTPNLFSQQQNTHFKGISQHDNQIIMLEEGHPNPPPPQEAPPAIVPAAVKEVPARGRGRGNEMERS